MKAYIVTSSAGDSTCSVYFSSKRWGGGWLPIYSPHSHNTIREHCHFRSSADRRFSTRSISLIWHNLLLKNQKHCSCFCVKKWPKLFRILVFLSWKQMISSKCTNSQTLYLRSSKLYSSKKVTSIISYLDSNKLVLFLSFLIASF